VLEFYRRFIFSSNFKVFVQYRIKEAYYNDLMHVDLKIFTQGNATDVALIDLYLRLKQDLDEEQKHQGYFAGDELYVSTICEKLQDLMREVITLLPDNLKGSVSSSFLLPFHTQPNSSNNSRSPSPSSSSSPIVVSPQAESNASSNGKYPTPPKQQQQQQPITITVSQPQGK